jgi:hypothetical protein
LSWSVADASAADLYLIEYNLASEWVSPLHLNYENNPIDSSNAFAKNQQKELEFVSLE